MRCRCFIIKDMNDNANSWWKFIIVRKKARKGGRADHEIARDGC